MHSQDLDFYIRATRARLEYLNLTYVQAEKVYLFEEGKRGNIGSSYLTVWEELDYDWTFYKEILDKVQWEAFQEFYQKTLAYLEKTDREADQTKQVDIAYYQELVQYYEKDFLPWFFKHPGSQMGGLLFQSTKLPYLKSEYKNFLIDTKTKILTEHFRSYKSFKPNELKAKLLMHQLDYLLPDYVAFERKMDKPTLAIAKFLKDWVKSLPEDILDPIDEKFQGLHEFKTTAFQKHFGKISGWHVSSEPMKSKKRKVYQAMRVLLIDRDKYGCKSPILKGNSSSSDF